MKKNDKTPALVENVIFPICAPTKLNAFVVRVVLTLIFYEKKAKDKRVTKYKSLGI